MKDSKGHGELTYEDFYEAVFELVDLWTTTAKPEEYIAFLNALTFRLKFGSNSGKAGAARHSLALRCISAVGVQTLGHMIS